MDGKLHQLKPDLDNLLKAVQDALFAEDRHVGHLGELSKVWVNQERGWIEFETKEPVYQEMEIPKTKKAIR